MDIVFLRADKGRDRPRERGPFVIALGQRRGSVATICINEAPIAPATAAADTAPWKLFDSG